MKLKMVYPIVVIIFLALSLNVHGQEELQELTESTFTWGHDISKEDEAKSWENFRQM